MVSTCGKMSALGQKQFFRTSLANVCYALFPFFNCSLRVCDKIRIVLSLPTWQAIVYFKPRNLTLDACVGIRWKILWMVKTTDHDCHVLRMSKQQRCTAFLAETSLRQF